MLHQVRKLRLAVTVNYSLVVLIIGQAVTALAGLAYGKLTSVYISPSIWGDYSLFMAAVTLLYGLFVTPTLQSFKAALARFPPKSVVAGYSLTLLFILVAAGLLLVVWAGGHDQERISSLIWIATVGQSFYQLGSSYLNALGQHRRYTLLQMGYATGTVLGFAFVIIGLDERTVMGLWRATALVNTGVALVVCWQFFHRTDLASQGVTIARLRPLISSYRRYVWPLLSLAFWTWLINYADRYLIRYYLTDADVGQYAMGYSLGSKLLLLVAPLLAFLSPQILRMRAADQAPQAANSLIYNYLIRYILLAGAGCGLFYAGRIWIGQLLLSERYAPAFGVGPIVALGYLFLTSVHLLELKWYAFGQTQFILWHNLFGALLNIGFNWLLIPRLGILGAALAQLLGFAGQFLLAIGLFSMTKPANQ